MATNNYAQGKSIIPTNIKNESEFTVKGIVLKQVDRITYMLSIAKATTQSTSENQKALGFGVKSGLLSLQALISPFLKPEAEYFWKSKLVQDELHFLEKDYSVNATDFRYWYLLNVWLGYLVFELSKLGYFPQEEADSEIDYD